MAPTVEKIGRYEIVSELGRGAMGLVYRAVDPNIGRTVALKTMRLDVHGMEHDEMLRRFRNEARAAGLMNHPNIVTIYDAEEVDGLFYIAMEYMEGETVQSFIVQKLAMPAEQIVDIGVQVCAGLEYAHQMKVIHRDIKPANIMITRQNVAKIMDFGISKALGSMTSTSQVLGTPNYMAPEQVKGLELDGRADLFSFGVVLYEMATGERPFAGQNVTTVIYKIVNENPVPPCDAECSVHPGLSAVIARCLAKNPEERYRSAADLARDLTNYRSIASDGDITSVIPTDARVQAAQSGPGTTSMSTGGPATSGSRPRQTIKQTTGIRRRAGVSKSTHQKNAAALTLLAMAVIGALAGLYRAKHHQRPLPPVPVTLTQITVPPPAAAQPASSTQSPAEANKPAVIDANAKPAKPETSARAEDVADEPSAKKSGDGKVQFKIRSTPEGAFIQVDGKSSEAWVTPFTMTDLTPGTHEFVFSKSGYSSETRSVEIGSKSASYHVDLAPITTAVALSSDPPGADIEIDGHDTTRMTPAQIPVAEGSHSIVLRLDGFRSAQVDAQVKKGEVFQFHPVLNPGDAPQAGNTSKLAKIFGGGFRASKGVIDFVTTPPGARIYIRGRAAQIATPAHAAFAPGDYPIELRQPGYKPVQKTVHVEPGKLVKLEVSLEPQ